MTKRVSTHRKKPGTDQTLCGRPVGDYNLVAVPTCKTCVRASGHADCETCKGTGWVTVRLPWTDKARKACVDCANN